MWLILKQHYVPQFYYKNFGEMVWCLDKTNENTFHTTPKNISFEPDFYGPSIDGEYPLETALDLLERRFSNAIRDLMDKEDPMKISLQSKLDLALFVAIQYLRTKETRERVVDVANSFADEAARHLLKIEDHGVKLTEAGEMAIHLDMLKDFPSFAATIAQMKFILMKNNTKTTFWTSDNPVALQNEYDQAPFGNLGITSKGIEMWTPISPKLVLVTCDPTMFGIHQDVIEINDEQIVIRNNWLQVISSTRFLMSNEKDFHMIHDMLEHSKELRNPKRKRVVKGILEPGMKIVKEKPEFWLDPGIIDKTRKEFDSKNKHNSNQNKS